MRARTPAEFRVAFAFLFATAFVLIALASPVQAAPGADCGEWRRFYDPPEGVLRDVVIRLACFNDLEPYCPPTEFCSNVDCKCHSLSEVRTNLYGSPGAAAGDKANPEGKTVCGHLSGNQYIKYDSEGKPIPSTVTPDDWLTCLPDTSCPDKSYCDPKSCLCEDLSTFEPAQDTHPSWEYVPGYSCGQINYLPREDGGRLVAACSQLRDCPPGYFCDSEREFDKPPKCICVTTDYVIDRDFSLSIPWSLSRSLDEEIGAADGSQPPQDGANAPGGSTVSVRQTGGCLDKCAIQLGDCQAGCSVGNDGTQDQACLTTCNGQKLACESKCDEDASASGDVAALRGEIAELRTLVQKLNEQFSGSGLCRATGQSPLFGEDVEPHPDLAQAVIEEKQERPFFPFFG